MRVVRHMGSNPNGTPEANSMHHSTKLALPTTHWAWCQVATRSSSPIQAATTASAWRAWRVCHVPSRALRPPFAVASRPHRRCATGNNWINKWASGPAITPFGKRQAKLVAMGVSPVPVLPVATSCTSLCAKRTQPQSLLKLLQQLLTLLHQLLEGLINNFSNC